MKMNTEILDTFPKIEESLVDQMLAEEIAKSKKKIVVLDDDPTGVQTVNGVSVYTDWEKESILKAFQEESSLFFILTNSRGFTVDQTTKAHHEIAEAVAYAAEQTKQEYLFVSRGDSTLRGHYPLETEILKEDYEKYTGNTVDGEILCPFFKEGGRFTIGNIHYAKYDDELIPVCETEFAKDKTFGYTALTMPEYVEEKTNGMYTADTVVCITLEELRSVDVEGIEKKLLEISGFRKIIVNAVDYADIKVFCIALYRAMEKGKNFMFRTAAAFVRVLGGIQEKPLLTREEMVTRETANGGVIVIGSHTAKTSRQLESLRELKEIEFIELDVAMVNDSAAFEAEVARCLKMEEECVRSGRTVCCYTSRKLFTAESGNKEDHLRLSVKISDAVQSLVGRLDVTPAFVIAKGGITSSDVGTKALRVKRATVLGQIKPGIPVWQTGDESKFPQIPYIIFPGNVGEDLTLKEAVQVLMKK